MERKIKLLFFHFDLGDGGAERVLVNLLNGLDKNKYEITLRTIFSGGINRDLLDSSIRFIPLFNRNAIKGMRLLLKLIPTWLIYKLLIKEKYDIEIAYIEGIPTRIISASSNRNKFAWIHTTADYSRSLESAFLSNKDFLSSYNKYKKIAFVSNKAKIDFEKVYPDIVTPKEVIHNVNNYRDIKKKALLDLPFPINQEILNLCSIGRLMKNKGIDRLIEALSILKQEGYRNWHLYIVGKGEEELNLKKLAQELFVSDEISFLGFLENPYSVLSKMDLMICSSFHEGFSTAATEAVVLGIPVLSTDCAGMEEIFEDGKSGFLVDNSKDGLINGLKKYFKLNTQEREALKIEALKRGDLFQAEAALKDFESFIEI